MIRTQIYITPEQDSFLRDEAYKNKSTKSDEIRKAVEFYRQHIKEGWMHQQFRNKEEQK